MLQRRILLVGIVILFVITIIVIRLAQIQLFDTKSFSEHKVNLITQSVSQRTSAFVINNGRGVFLNRSGEVLSGRKKNALVLFPFLQHMSWPAEKIANILNVNVNELRTAVAKTKRPFVFNQGHVSINNNEKQAINDLAFPGVHVLHLRLDRSTNAAPYLIGFTGENKELVQKRYPELLDRGVISKKTSVGLSGLQKAFDSFLISRETERLLYHTTAIGLPMFEDSLRYASGMNTEYFPLKIKTTLDSNFQAIVEEALRRYPLEQGGIVLLDVQSSDLLAMANRPTFSGKKPYHSGHANHMLRRYHPGSIFKVVTAAAAIENNILSPNQTFNCNVNIYGDAPSKRQLGKLSFQESFYQSCNHTFSELANRLMRTDLNVINKSAAKLGLTGRVGWQGDVFHYEDFQQFPSEAKNVIWGDDEDQHDAKAIAQTAIGQRNVQVTPLSVTNMMANIARGGHKRTVRAVSKILYRDGEMTLTTFPTQEPEEQELSPYTIMRLQKLLRGVVADEDGTAHRLHDLPYAVSGKSGTAETGKNHLNHWFTGYFPADNPQFAMTVVNLKAKPSEDKIYKLYAYIVEQLFKAKNSRST